MQSEAQRRAMFAAKAGNSSVGIPRAVGADFADHDQGGKLPNYAAKTKSGLKRKALAGTKPKTPVTY
jgi:hypothetical protein